MNNMAKNWKSILFYILIPVLLMGQYGICLLTNPAQRCNTPKWCRCLKRTR